MKNAAHYYANIDIFVLNYSFFFFFTIEPLVCFKFEHYRTKIRFIARVYVFGVSQVGGFL